MPAKKIITTPLIVFAGALVSLAVLGAVGPQDGNRPPGERPPGEFGKGEGPGGPPPGFGPGTFLAPQIIEIADQNADESLSVAEASQAAAKFIREADTNKKGSIDAETLARAINRHLGPPPGAGPGGPPGDFGPGNFIAPAILEAADTDKDGRLSPTEASQAAEGFIKEADTAKKGSLSTDLLAAAMNRRIGPPPGFGGPGGGPGGPMGQERKLVKQFDKNSDQRLDRDERQSAREFLKTERAKGGGRRGFGPPPGFRGEDQGTPVPGAKLSPDAVPTFAGKPLYDPTVVRTLFLDFDDKDWEPALADFYHTDVELPATLIVDGKKYPGIGAHFRGLSSFMGVREGHKRSLNLSIDFTNSKQRLLGYKTLNLLNAHEDPTFLHTVLYFDIARHYIPAPKANFVRLVINGESWGIYVSAQQFDKTFLTENYATGKGARWKVPGNPGGDGGLSYVGDKVEDYKRRYQIKTDDDPKDWSALINLCRTLNQTPADQLEKALSPILDIEGALWFLALDNALINSDGYWIRSSDYSIYRDEKGKFHVIPHDANETFQPAMQFGPGGPGRGGFGGRGGRGGAQAKGGFDGRGGPQAKGGFEGAGGPQAKGGFGGRGGPQAKGGFGGRGGMGGGPRPANVDLDPLVGLDDPRKPLRSKLLAVPALKARYLAHVRTIATDWLDWNKLGPVIEGYHTMIVKEVEADTRKLSSFAAFEKSLGITTSPANTEPASPRERPSMSLKAFAEQRSKFLLSHPEIKKLAP